MSDVLSMAAYAGWFAIGFLSGHQWLWKWQADAVAACASINMMVGHHLEKARFAGPNVEITSLLSDYQGTMSINRPSTARDASLVSYVRQYGAAYTLSNEVSIDGNPFSRLLVPSIPVPERSDFILRCTYVSATNTDVTASWSGILRVND